MKRAFKRISLPKRVVSTGERDSSLALINVAFLLLVFLLVAGSFQPFIPKGFEWAQTRSEIGRGVISEHIILDAAGRIWYQGAEIASEELIDRIAGPHTQGGSVTVLVDRRAKIGDLSLLTGVLREAGIGNIRLIALETGKL